MTFFWRIFSFFYGLMEFIYAYHSGLKVWVLLVQDTFRLPPVTSAVVQYILSFQLLLTQSLAWDLFTTTSVPKLIFFFPISADGRRRLFPLTEEGGYFRFGILANHLASIFFLPLSGDSLGLLYVPVPLSLPIRSQSTNICWFPFWPGFVTSGLTNIISLNGYSLTAC